MEQALEIAGTITGLIYLWLEYKASIYLWIASIIMPSIYLFVYYQAGLYADFGINLYYLAVAIYGWFLWKYGHTWKKHPLTDSQPSEQPITHVPQKTALSDVCYLCGHLFLDSLPPALLYRQQCALARFLYHRPKHYRHVDAGT